MVYRLSAAAIVGAVLLDLFRLQRLLRPTESAASWEIILIAAVILGGVITWVARAYRVGRFGTLALNLGGMLLAVFRIGAPEANVRRVNQVTCYTGLICRSPGV